VGIEKRGFASMDHEKRREIASRGGRAAHEKGTAHKWTRDEAREAGRKGGIVKRRPLEPQNQGQDDQNPDQNVPVPEDTASGFNQFSDSRG